MAFWVRKAGLLTSCSHPSSSPYPHRLEKVKFGVPLHEVCKNNIPGPLLVLILKLNKEAPQRKDVFRAPGNSQAMKKLILYLQSGRLVNVENYSVYTIASVLKKFLRKIPGGIFGREGEAELFEIVDIDDEYIQQERIHRSVQFSSCYQPTFLSSFFIHFAALYAMPCYATLMQKRPRGLPSVEWYGWRILYTNCVCPFDTVMKRRRQ